MRQAQSQNPLILLDEIDKVSQDFKGDISSALLEVLDREQNFSFMDHYLELATDLSDVLFITTANSLEPVPRPLLDRMEVIELSSYTEDEKLAIATNYLIPKQLSRHGLKKQNLKISDAVTLEIIRSYTREAGVRNLERQIETLCRKTAKAIVCGEKKSVTLSGANLKNYLGPKRYRYDAKEDADEVGVVCGLAWTAVGGDTLSVEVNVMDGTGKVELTGSLGDVMKESAMAAISYIRAKTDFYGISPTFYKDKDIHIHVPEGATPKDGPSAGVTIATAVVSALTGRKVKKDVAMTGEITLRGRVLAIGGLKEKTIAAYRYGITTVVIPEENRRDLEEIPEKVKTGLKFVFAKTADTAVLTALCPAEGKTAEKKEAGKRSLPVLPEEDAPGARLVQ